MDLYMVEGKASIRIRFVVAMTWLITESGVWQSTKLKKKDSNVDRDGREEMSWIGMSKEEGKYKWGVMIHDLITRSMGKRTR